MGGLFRLQPNRDLQFDSCALPYAELSATISDIVLEPASAIDEHYSPPGTAAELQSKARSKADRGWQVCVVHVTAECAISASVPPCLYACCLQLALSVPFCACTLTWNTHAHPRSIPPT